MKEVYLQFDLFVDKIKVPDNVFADIGSHRLNFFRWIQDKNNDHGYWVFSEGRRMGVRYAGDAFVKYLNEVVLKDSREKAVYKYRMKDIPIPEGAVILTF